MNLALDRFADNPIIDELIMWPPRRQRIVSVRACSSMFRKPFIEVELDDKTRFHRHFQREGFADYWAEAVVILRALTDIECLAEFRYTPLPDADSLAQNALTIRDECLAEAEQMYRQGMYAQYLMQFGPDCSALPAATEQMLADARQRVQAGD